MGINASDDRATAVTPETYFTFCGLMVAGSIFAFMFVLHPSKVVKSSGSVVQFERTSITNGLGELKHVAKLFGNKYMLLLTPLIIQVSNRLKSFNAHYLNRTSSIVPVI